MLDESLHATSMIIGIAVVNQQDSPGPQIFKGDFGNCNYEGVCILTNDTVATDCA
mgnify:CR=1 FL=1